MPGGQDKEEVLVDSEAGGVEPGIEERSVAREGPDAAGDTLGRVGDLRVGEQRWGGRREGTYGKDPVQCGDRLLRTLDLSQR